MREAAQRGFASLGLPFGARGHRATKDVSSTYTPGAVEQLAPRIDSSRRGVPRRKQRQHKDYPTVSLERATKRCDPSHSACGQMKQLWGECGLRAHVRRPERNSPAARPPAPIQRMEGGRLAFQFQPTHLVDGKLAANLAANFATASSML